MSPAILLADCGVVRWNFRRWLQLQFLLSALPVLFAMQQSKTHHQPQQEQQQQVSSSLSLKHQLTAANNNNNYHTRIFLIRHGETDWNDQGKLQGGGTAAIGLNEKGQRQAARLARELQQSLVDDAADDDGTSSTTMFDVIASSNLQRACQTADALMTLQCCSSSSSSSSRSSNDSRTRRCTLTGFREMDYGIHEGLHIHGPASTMESRRIFEQYVNPMQAGDLDLAWPGGGESIRQVEQRAVQALHQVLQQQQLTARRSSLSSSRGDCSDDGNVDGNDTLIGSCVELTGTASSSTTTRRRPKTNIAIVAHAILNRVLLAAMLQGDATHFVDYRQDNCCINVIDQLDDGSFRAVVLNYNQHNIDDDDNDDDKGSRTHTRSSSSSS
jgi:broad specificity phosphatase PhoE